MILEPTAFPRDESGNRRGSRIGADVTEQRQAEETRLRYAAIVESTDDAVIGMDRDGTVTSWNNGAERLFGYSAQEAIGKNVLFLSSTNCSADGAEVLKKVLKGEVLRHHETVR